jgi:hypothetical protein
MRPSSGPRCGVVEHRKVDKNLNLRFAGGFHATKHPKMASIAELRKVRRNLYSTPLL